MGSFIDPILDSVDSLLAWFSSSVMQSVDSYCDLETADDNNSLVARDGSLLSIIQIHGVTKLIGNEEFQKLHYGIANALRTSLKRAGHALQVYFSYDRENVKNDIEDILNPAILTSKRLNLNLDDLFKERVNHLSRYCAHEDLYFVLWTRPFVIHGEQLRRAHKEKLDFIKEHNIPFFKNGQNLIAGIPYLREAHNSFVSSVVNELSSISVKCDLLSAHESLRVIRTSVDPEFTNSDWRPVLPGDKIPVRVLSKIAGGELSSLMYPPLSRQVFPRDAELIDLRTIRIGDRIYSPLFIELFPQDIKPFMNLLNRAIPTNVPWRISFLMCSNGLPGLGFKAAMASILAWTSSRNGLISDANKLLQDIAINTDDAVIKLQVSLTTWVRNGNILLLRTRVAELAKAVEGWGNCQVSEVSGDVFAGVASSILGFSANSIATPTIAPLEEVVYMLPFTRPASSWKNGAILFRSPDGKIWPYQPGSNQQTTWIDLIYARPGSGKSVLSNSINLALCLSGGIQRLPQIAIIDIGPSSSGLISLIKESLPPEDRHLVAYHRLSMAPDYNINPFDTQLGCRFPTSPERAFLVNFITLLATPLGADRPYDGIPDMSGLVIDELYKQFSDQGQPHLYTRNIESLVDDLLDEIGFVFDEHTTWWEVTDALFIAGFQHQATLAQRFAMPILADITSICRSKTVEDLYGQVKTSTGESLVQAFSRMISSAIREYLVLSSYTKFDLGQSRIISLDLDEVAKSGGEAADRQTSVMYMLARYVMARNYYLSDSNLIVCPEIYRNYHRQRINEIKEDPKRIVYDEFHRTSKSSAVREQVILDMREGRKWNVQIALISQSLDDFDPVMVEFATSIFIMDAGPEQSIRKSTEIFGLSETATTALRTRVHGPKEGGATFLAQFSTKSGINTQLLTSTIGPVELWSFSTTAEDASIRNKLYQHLGPQESRRILANLFPSGSVKKLIETRLAASIHEENGIIEEKARQSIIDILLKEILDTYSNNPDARSLIAMS